MLGISISNKMYSNPNIFFSKSGNYSLHLSMSLNNVLFAVNKLDPGL